MSKLNTVTNNTGDGTLMQFYESMSWNSLGEFHIKHHHFYHGSEKYQVYNSEFYNKWAINTVL